VARKEAHVKTDISVGTVRSADGTAIAFDRSGVGEPVILVGGALNDRSFEPLTELAALLAPDFTVYTFDRRGRGDSGDTLPYSPAREIEDLEALIAHAGGSAYVYGLSSGAILALEAAARGVAITRMALFEPPVTIEEEEGTDQDLDVQIEALISSNRRGDAVELFLTVLGLPAEQIAEMRASPIWASWEGMAHTLPYEFAVTGDRSLVTERLASVNVPTIVITSGASSYFADAARAVVDALPDGELRTIEGEFHDVAAPDLAREIRAFFAA
jgi:pimeloyl-ACP methyl ester carboxylesterase